MKLIQGDCIEVMKTLKDNSVDTVITDPPYGLQFMDKDWDKLWRNQTEADQDYIERTKKEDSVWRRNLPSLESTGKQMQEFHYNWATEALRVAKPGAMMFCFGGTRTFHRIACGIEDAGWEIRDTIMWLYGSGFPKSHDISKAIDEHFGAEREVVGKSEINIYKENKNYKFFDESEGNPEYEKGDITAPATDEAKLWDGWGTALKPAFEPIIVAMKPREGTFVENALKYDVAGLNIDGGRVPISNNDRHEYGINGDENNPTVNTYGKYERVAYKQNKKGRWPANIVHDGSEEVKERFPDSAGVENRQKIKLNSDTISGIHGIYGHHQRTGHTPSYPGSGSTSRFFYIAKASKKERNSGEIENKHPTVKPLSLMVYLARLTSTPTGGVVLDPFMGSGTTGMACKRLNRNFVGIELDEHYFEIAEKRIASVIQVELL